MTAVGRDTIDKGLGRRAAMLILEWNDTQTPIAIGAFIYRSGAGAVTYGPLKLAQRCLLELLTARRSVAFEPDGRGCSFLPRLWAGNLQTPALVDQAFVQAAYEIRDTLKAEEDDELPNDERFGSMRLNSSALFKTTAELDLTVIPAVGRSPRIILPILTVPPV